MELYSYEDVIKMNSLAYSLLPIAKSSSSCQKHAAVLMKNKIFITETAVCNDGYLHAEYKCCKRFRAKKRKELCRFISG